MNGQPPQPQQQPDPPFWKMPPAYFAGAGAIIILVHFLAPLAYVVPARLSGIGMAIMLAGFGLAILADGRFKKTGATVKPFREPSILVTDGPFRFSRHPMYLGMIVTLVGLVLALGSLLPMVVLPFFVWLINERFVIPEEAAMEEKFGEKYRAYKKQVRRWI